jgi:hypothetical protein
MIFGNHVTFKWQMLPILSDIVRNISIDVKPSILVVKSSTKHNSEFLPTILSKLKTRIGYFGDLRLI